MPLALKLSKKILNPILRGYMDKDLKNKLIPELEEILDHYKERKYIASALFSWVQQKCVESLSEMTNVSKQLRQKLQDDGYYISQLKVKQKLVDPDGTIKYQFALSDGELIETVVLNDEERITLCISCQVGCKMDCLFCATGKLGFKRNLNAGEIVDQIIQVEKQLGKINNIVYMGMGEPFDNYDEVLRSVKILNDVKGKNIGARHITLSTCGIVPGIQELTKEDIQVRLAISLHADNDELRNKIMKINNRYPIKELLSAVREYQKQTKRRVTFEYVMIKGVNDTPAQAQRLAKLLRGIKCNINLIEYNQYGESDFLPSDRQSIKAFRFLLDDAGFEVNMRFKRGQSIKAACGQLGLLE